MTTEQQQAPGEPKPSLFKRQIGGSGKPKSAAPKSGKLGVPPLPQVNLMPPEILEGRDLAVLRRKLVWAIIALLLVVLLAFGAAYYLRTTANSRYDDSLAAADTLTAQKRQYSPVIQVQRDITNTTKGRDFALYNEVDWTSYVYSIQSVLPKGVTVETAQVAAIGPGEELTAGADDLTQPGLAVITFSASSDTLPDASEWIAALESVPGLADVNLQSSVLQAETGAVTYLVSVTVQVTEDARANRTFPDEATTGDDTESGS